MFNNKNKLMKGLVLCIVVCCMVLQTACSKAEEANDEVFFNEAKGAVVLEEPETFTVYSNRANPFTDMIFVSPEWEYDMEQYGQPNEVAAEHWENFLKAQEDGASADELTAILSRVIADDETFIPAYIESAKYYIEAYNKQENLAGGVNAMDTLTYGYLNTGDEIFNELKDELGWPVLEEIIREAENALENNDTATAYETINKLPEKYFGDLESFRILDILNHFDDTYYYLILGPAAGNQYIVHFKLDGTYERVKMNETGLYDSGTYEYGYTEDWDLYFAGLPFINRGVDFYWIEYDENYNSFEYNMTQDEEGRAKAQFEDRVNGTEETVPDQELALVGSPMIQALIDNKWQVWDGSYYEFSAYGSGTIYNNESGVAYNFTYTVPSTEADYIVIFEEDNPYDYEWIYDFENGTFCQKAVAYDENTGKATTSYQEVNKYKG